MELKLAKPLALCCLMYGFNRTFMELKFIEKLGEIEEKKVLIVPLWN